ncbi:peptidoglycan-binding domain-containing protein [Capilliphycus salinus ALCB114379]|uniref:peptidoglycan-binding domain-containing protein n=1 Tax=Capilliphycus salinus TaxID=2768948 RepID=UPI0039A40420
MTHSHYYPEAVLSQPTLRRGSQGEAVIRLQNRLNDFGFRLVVDGIFGPATEAAVKRYQSNNRLTVDGIVGPQTWSALFHEFL